MKIFILILVLTILWSTWGYFASRAESAAYSVVEKKDGYEIREYTPHIIAQTNISGDYKDSMNSGFRIIASYIFGGNTRKENLAMTVPVLSKDARVEPSNEKIAMTVPVLTKIDADTRTMSFIMPGSYTLETLPIPTDTRVKLIEVPTQTKAVLRFYGYRTEARIEKNKSKLQSLLKRDGLSIYSTSEFAVYNGPGTPPWMTRHEILIQIK